MKLEKLGKIIDYIKDDLTSWYELKKEVSVRIAGEGITDLFGKQERMICLKHLTIYVDVLGSSVTLTAHPFTAEDKLWNGANVIPNTDYESMLASLFHDLLYEYMDEIAKQCNESKRAVRKWADDILYTIWAGASTSRKQKFLARAGHAVCRMFGGIFHSVAKWFIIIISILAIVGCTVPKWNLVDVQGGEAVQEVISGGK